MIFPRLVSRFAAACSAAVLLLASCQMPMPPQQGGYAPQQAYQPGPAQQQQPYSGPFMLGVDVLASRGFDLIRGKRVGLITNHTSLTGHGERTRTVFQRALGPNLTALYAPEHGIDGNIGAGVHVSTRRDPVTGLTVYSLYGPTRKPTPAMLAPIDVLVFDLQDIGCRSYTYISTMIVAMEAAAENGKQFVVLDRPNPLGGWRVEGPPLEAKWKSFVGQIPVPYVHGMTAGELAMMASARGWMAKTPRLDVVKMQGWQRGMVWQDTGLRWHPTSPNIPHAISPSYYVTTGILGGASAVDIGIGTDEPFGYAGALGVNADALLRYCRSLNTPGVTFSSYSKNGFGGVRIHISPHNTTDLTALDVLLLGELNRLSGGRVLGRMSGSKLNLFHKVYGSESLYHDLRRGVPAQNIAARWQGWNQSFRSQRQRFLLYP